MLHAGKISILSQHFIVTAFHGIEAKKNLSIISIVYCHCSVVLVFSQAVNNTVLNNLEFNVSS